MQSCLKLNPCSDSIYRCVKSPEPLNKNLSVSTCTYHSTLFASCFLFHEGSLQSQIRVHHMCSFATFISLLALPVETMLLPWYKSLLSPGRGDRTATKRGWKWWASTLTCLTKQQLKSSTYQWFIGRKYAKQGPMQWWLMAFVHCGDD